MFQLMFLPTLDVMVSPYVYQSELPDQGGLSYFMMVSPYIDQSDPPEQGVISFYMMVSPSPKKTKQLW